MLYFIYNHMIDLKDLSEPGCSDFECLGTATVQNHRMVFRVLPDIEPAEDQCVTGLLFHINHELVDLLNKDMECPNLYTKRYIHVWCNGLIRSVVYTQKFTKKLSKHPPPPEYLANLYKLYMETGLPLNQLNEALKCSTI